MKKYNQYEMRFLQVLVSKERLLEILEDQMFIFKEEMLWRGHLGPGILSNDGKEWLKGIVDGKEEIDL